MWNRVRMKRKDKKLTSFLISGILTFVVSIKLGSILTNIVLGMKLTESLKAHQKPTSQYDSLHYYTKVKQIK